MKIRTATNDDAEAIRAIYNDAVLTSTATTDTAPRSAEDQLVWLNDRSGAHVVLVAEIDSVVVGFSSLSPYRVRPAYSPTVENSVYIDQDRHGDGIGTALLAELLTVAARHGFHSVIARITVGHDASLKIHRSAGFEMIGTEREVGRKFNQWLDVATLQKML